MQIPLEGGCQCGAVRYQIHGEPLSLVVCHCTECQRMSGSAFGMSLIVKKPEFSCTGAVKRFRRSSDSGMYVDCFFCPECGNRIFHEPERLQGMAVNVRAGTLDDTSVLKPAMQVWTKSKQPWVEIPQGMPTREGQP